MHTQRHGVDEGRRHTCLLDGGSEKDRSPREERGPNASVAQVLPCYRVLRRIEAKLD
jgi:hypothetical protein